MRSGHVMWGDGRIPGDEFLSDPARFAREDLCLETTAPGALASGFVCTFPGIGYARLVDLARAGLACQLPRVRGWRIGPMRVVITLADGALDVDREMRVLHGQGKPIERLCACGTSTLGGSRWAATATICCGRSRPARLSRVRSQTGSELQLGESSA